MNLNWNSIKNIDQKSKQIEEIENKYLNKYFYFLKYCLDEMLEGFKTKEKIKSDWMKYWNAGNLTGTKLSDFDTGAERIVYALLNGKGIGQPNSAPVGSDLFFEVSDAFIHIDMKTVQTENIGDFNTSIFVGENQNSYNGTIDKNNGLNEEYTPSLPYFYKINNDENNQKICLTYFITILYERENLDILCISLICMPNGFLEYHYKSRPLKAGKNPGKARFNFSEVPDFEFLENKKRIKIIYMNENLIKNMSYEKKLDFLINIYNNQPNI